MATATKYNYDPSVPVYAAPDVKFSAVDLDKSKMQNPTTTVDKGTATVAGQLNGLLSSGSPLLKAAQSSAQRAANSRGLLNSSISAGEGTKAMIETATPIAQQDAQTYADLTKANNDTINNSLLNNQVSALETNKAANEGLISGALNQQQIAGNLTQQEMEGQQSLTLQKESDTAAMSRAKLDSETTLKSQKMSDDSALERLTLQNQNSVDLQKLSDAAQYDRLKIEQDTEKLIQSMEVNQNNKEALMAVVSNMGQDMVSSINNILLNEKLDGAAKTSAIKAITANYKASVNTASSIAGLGLTWGTELGTGVASTTKTTNTGTSSSSTWGTKEGYTKPWSEDIAW